MDIFLVFFTAFAAICLTSRVASESMRLLYHRHRGELAHPGRLRQTVLARAALFALLSALLGTVLLLKFPMPLPFAVQFFLCQCALVCIVTDYEQQLIFDQVLLAMAALALAASPVLPAPLWDRVLAALAGGGAMLALALLLPGGALGGGDIKLLGALGFWLGLGALQTILTTGFLGGGFAALLLLLRGRGRRTHFAYGPYFVFGALLHLFTG